MNPETGPPSSQAWQRWPLPIPVCTHRWHNHLVHAGADEQSEILFLHPEFVPPDYGKPNL
jgi:hypothetical protein